VVRPKKVVGLDETKDGRWRVKFESREEVVARYVVGADGAHSSVSLSSSFFLSI